MSKFFEEEHIEKKKSKRPISDEQRQKVSESTKLNWKNPEIRKKMMESQRGRKASKEALENMRLAQKRKSDRSKFTFESDSRKFHGDKYDYSKFVYVEAHTKGIIICPEHGEFLQTPNQHRRGSGCFRCGVDLRAKLKFEEKKNSIIEKFRKVHGNFYDYSKVDYKGITKKVIIICPKHGEFLQTPNGHANQGYGCTKCAVEKRKITSQMGKL